MRRPHLLAVATALLLAGPLSSAGSDWEARDAESLGQGGVSAVGRLERSPGACVEAGASARFTVQEPYVGTDLVAGSIVLQVASPDAAFAIGLAQLQSPVHRDTELDLGLQVRRGALCLGAGATLDALAFTGYPTLFGLVTRLGAGGKLPYDALVAGVLELGAGGAGARLPRVVVAAEVPLTDSIRLSLQHEREPGVASRTLAGLAWTHAVLRLLAGWDATTRSGSMGVACVWPHRRLAWAATSHSELGWSHAWTCGFQR